MESMIKKFPSGTVKACTYFPDDKKTMTHARSVVSDIWEYAEDFANNIIWIYRVIPVNGKTIKDVLVEFLKSEAVTKNDIVCAQAGTVGNMSVIGSTTEGLEVITADRTQLKDSGFVNITFNRRASRSYGNPEVFTYKNEACTAFLDKNVGNDKLVNRFE